MKKILLFLTILATGTLVFAQKTINDANAEKRNLNGNYHAIVVADGIDLYISQGDESVAVSASEKRFLDKINTVIEDGVLKIWYGDHYKNFNIDFDWHKKNLKAYVSFKELDKLTASGGSDVFVDGLIKVRELFMHLSGGSDFNGKVELDALKVNTSGGSDVKISGLANTVNVEASGGSDFKGYELVADIGNMKASGGSDIFITINKELSVQSSGGSDVFYKGSGTIKEMRSSGSSSIKKTSK